jgi:hypothetical protein
MRVIKKFVNNTMNLEQAARQLIRTIAQQDSLDEQLRSCAKPPEKKSADRFGYERIASAGGSGLVTPKAIARLKPEMHLAMQGYDLFTPPMALIGDGPGGTYSCIHLCENPGTSCNRISG